MKETWQQLAKTLRKRGWNYHRIEWLTDGPWRVEIQQCESNGDEHESIEAERPTLLAAYRAVVKASERRVRV